MVKGIFKWWEEIMDLNLASELEVISWLKQQDDLYENEGESSVSDEEYDRVRRQAQIQFGSNTYFTGVGADVRGGKVRLPFPMNGLTQVYEGDTLSWVKKTSADDEVVVLSDKLDGTSAQILYDPNGDLQIAFSRGNGTEGADITRHMRQIKSVPKKIPACGRTMAVRAEMVIRKKNFPIVQAKFPRSGGEQFKNARNAVAGIMNSSTNDPALYDYIDCVAYTIIDTLEDKLSQFRFLDAWGFKVARYVTEAGKTCEDAVLTAHLNRQRETSEYDIDGIVIDLDRHALRVAAMQIGQAPSVKYKVADADNLKTTVVKEVLWRASKDGYLKPRVQFDPIELVGVTVNYATAFNAKFIMDNRIGPGAKISITRSGDVIPYIVRVDEPAMMPAMPNVDEWGDWEWNANQVDAVLSDSIDRKDVRVRKFVDVFTKLNVDNLKEGSAERLFDAGFHSIESIMNASKADLTRVLGENGSKVYDSMRAKLTNIYWPEFVGSLGFMGRGIGRKKMTILFNALEGDLTKMKDLETVLGIEGFQLKTASRVVDGIEAVEEFLAKVQGNVTIAGYAPKAAPIGNKMAGQAVVFTGVRSAELEKKIQEQGGEIKSGISKAVTILVCKDPTSGSSKMKKAMELGIRVMTIRDLEMELM
jgi:NAD-dependent DNA ligase